MKVIRNKTELILLLLAFSTNWYALIADDYGYTSRNGFSLSRYICALAYIFVASTLSHINASTEHQKIRIFLKRYWEASSIISFCGLFLIGKLEIETIWVLLIEFVFGAATFLFTPFLVLLPVFHLLMSQWTVLGWMEIRSYHIIFVFFFSACQLLCIHRRELHQFYVNLSVHRING